MRMGALSMWGGGDLGAGPFQLNVAAAGGHVGSAGEMHIHLAALVGCPGSVAVNRDHALQQHDIVVDGGDHVAIHECFATGGEVGFELDHGVANKAGFKTISFCAGALQIAFSVAGVGDAGVKSQGVGNLGDGPHAGGAR